MDKLNLITGATGLLGSHIAEQLVANNERVRALVRPTSNTSFLEKLGVELAIGDMTDGASIRRATEGASVVYHCAAFVGDWGSWHKFYQGTVQATRNLVEACQTNGNTRIVHVSSISVYGVQNSLSGDFTEELPTGQHHWLWDYYGKSKVLAEEQLKGYPNYVIVRPSWVYGPRDRVSIPRVVESLRAGRVRIIGSGENVLNMIYAADVARGIILAANSPSAGGKAYHLCSYGEITQRAFVNLFCERLNLPRVERQVPLKLAWKIAFLAELVFRLLRRPQPPPFTRRALYLIGRTTQYSIARAEKELGWRPQVPVREGLEHTLRWYLNEKK